MLHLAGALRTSHPLFPGRGSWAKSFKPCHDRGWAAAGPDRSARTSTRPPETQVADNDLAEVQLGAAPEEDGCGRRACAPTASGDSRPNCWSVWRQSQAGLGGSASKGTYMERKIPLADHRLLTVFAHFMAFAWKAPARKTTRS